MKGTMVVNGFLTGGKFGEPAQMLSSAAERAGIVFDIVRNTDICSPIGSEDTLRRILGDPDFILFWDKDIRSARNLELCGFPVFNRSEFLPTKIPQKWVKSLIIRKLSYIWSGLLD